MKVEYFRDIPFYYTPDYCVVIWGGLKLRDVQGKDLVYLDALRETSGEINHLSFCLDFLTRFLVKEDPSHPNVLEQLSHHQLSNVFHLYLEKVLRNPISRDTWLNNVYYLNNQSFAGLDHYENVPLTEFYYMIEVFKSHQAAVKAEMDNN